MKKIYRNNYRKGFTLIETLVVLGIFSIIGTIVVSLLFVSLRGTKKTELSIEAKQNGDLALFQILRQIRYAKTIDNPSSCIPSTTVSAVTITSYSDNAQTTFSCPTGSSTTITSNSASLIDDNRFLVANCSFTCTQQDVALPPTINIKFTLNLKGANSLTETMGSYVFESAVTHRNFNR